MSEPESDASLRQRVLAVHAECKRAIETVSGHALDAWAKKFEIKRRRSADDQGPQQTQRHRHGWLLSDVRCARCVYFRDSDGTHGASLTAGVCWRYPEPVARKPKHWCGEFDPLDGVMP